MRLQVTLRQVGALAARYHAAHVEGAAVALLNALHRVGAAIQVEAGKQEQLKHQLTRSHQVCDASIIQNAEFQVKLHDADLG